MSLDDHPKVTAVRSALRAGGAAESSIAGLRVLPDEVRTAAAAAAALGVEVGQIANSLVFAATVGGEVEPLLVLTSGAHRVDTGKVAALVGAERIDRAKPDFVLTATGQAIGGVAPVGHPAPVRTLVDRDLAAFDVVWAAGGIPHAVFPTTFDELVLVTGGVPADVA